MSAGLKRSLSTGSRSISPPHVKRKFHSNQSLTASTPQVELTLNEIRIFSWNVNGTGPLTQKKLDFGTDSSYPLRRFLRSHGWPHLLCLQEVKISNKDNAGQRRLEYAANHGATEDEPKYMLHFSLPRDKYNAIGFGGRVHGVASLIRNDFVANVKETRKPDWDLEGRVLIHETLSGLVVINGYWINGTFNPYRHPESGNVDGTRHDHKLRFHQHMLADVLEFEKRGLSVLLVGDMNVARTRIDGHPNLRTSPDQHVKNRADFNRKFFTSEDGMQAVDVFRQLHGEARKYTYFSPSHPFGQSCDRVDLIIASKSLVHDYHAVVGTDICDNKTDLGHSDHVPIWVTLDWAKIQASTTEKHSERR